jgi:hypothetical protein
MRVHCVKKARKADPDIGIAIGDSYYWWKFRFGGIHKSKTYPKRSQLTQSSFLSGLWTAQEACDKTLGDGSYHDHDDVEAAIEELKIELEDLRDECQNSLDNMPDSLKENSSSGQLLQERIDQLEEYVGNLDSIDLSELEEEEDNESAFETVLGEVESADPGIS